MSAVDGVLDRVITQGEALVYRLRYAWMTYGEMQRTGISTSPQKRVMEYLERRDDLELLKTRGEDGLIRWRVALRKPRRV